MTTWHCDWTNRAGIPVGRAEFDTEAAAEHEAAWRRRDGGRAVVWCRGGVEEAAKGPEAVRNGPRGDVRSGRVQIDLRNDERTAAP